MSSVLCSLTRCIQGIEKDISCTKGCSRSSTRLVWQIVDSTQEFTREDECRQLATASPRASATRSRSPLSTTRCDIRYRSAHADARGSTRYSSWRALQAGNEPDRRIRRDAFFWVETISNAAAGRKAHVTSYDRRLQYAVS
jgi:hypothetical protein